MALRDEWIMVGLIAGQLLTEAVFYSIKIVGIEVDQTG